MPAASLSVIKAAEPASDRSLLINVRAVLHTGGEDVILLLAPSTTFPREPLALTVPDDAAVSSLGAIMPCWESSLARSKTPFFFPYNALKDHSVTLGEPPDQNYGFSRFESLSNFKPGFLRQRKQLAAHVTNSR